MSLGLTSNFSLQTSAAVTPMMAIGSARSFVLRGKSQTQFTIQRALLSGRNLLRAMYHCAVETPGLDASLFDDPAALTRNSGFFTNMDSELYYIPIGICATMRSKSRTYVGGFYMELCMLNSYSLSVSAGQTMIGEGCSGTCDRVMPFQASDAIGSIATNGRVVMDAALGMASNAFPVASTSTIASFNDDGLDSGVVDSI